MLRTMAETEDDSGHRPKERRRKGPSPATPESLLKAALRYLDRYATSRANLRRVLLARVERSAWAHGSDREAGAAAVEQILERCSESGLLDDQAYAAGQARRHLRKGASARAIRAKLAAKGLDRETIEQALAGLDQLVEDPELSAALAYARRRRMGPYRPADQRPAQRERDLAALDRRGFAYETALKIVDAADPDALEAEIETL